MTLDQMPLLQEATIIRTDGAGPLRLRLLDMGLIRGTRVTIQKVAPMGDPLEINLRGYSLTLRREDARVVEVMPL